MTDHVCDPNNPDCAAYLYYLDPEHLRPAGPGRRQKRVGMRLVNGAIASMPRVFFGGFRTTTSSGRYARFVPAEEVSRG